MYKQLQRYILDMIFSLKHLYNNSTQYNEFAYDIVYIYDIYV